MHNGLHLPKKHKQVTPSIAMQQTYVEKPWAFPERMNTPWTAYSASTTMGMTTPTKVPMSSKHSPSTMLTDHLTSLVLLLFGVLGLWKVLWSASGAEEWSMATTQGFANDQDVTEGAANSAADNEMALVSEEVGTDTPVSAYVTLGSVFFIYLSNQWSRQLINYVCNFSSADGFRHLNAAIAMSREQYALLSGAGFTICYALTAVVAGNLTDRLDRKKLLVGSALVWSAATAAQSLTVSFSHIVILRSIQGVSQAFCTPAAYTLIADVFPKDRVAFANAVFACAMYLGGALASLGILLNDAYGWRNTTVIIGVFGIMTALSAIKLVTVPERLQKRIAREKKTAGEVVNTAAVQKKQESLGQVIWQVFTNVWNDAGTVLGSPGSRLLALAACFRFCAGFSIGTWNAPFMLEKFPQFALSFSAANAAVIGIGGLLSSLIGGHLADKLFKQNAKQKLWVPAIGSLLAVPAFALFVRQTDPYAALACLFVEYLVAECWVGPTLAALYDMVPRDKRGSAQGLFTTLTAFATIGPILVGTLAGGAVGNLGSSLLWVAGGAYLMAGSLFALAASSTESKTRSPS